MTMKSSLALCVAVLAVLGSVRGQTIAELAASTPEFSTLYAAVEAAGLGETLANPDVNLTVFAPTNQAFAELLLALNIADPADLLSQTDALRSILAYHVIGMPYMLADLTDGEVLPTLLEGYSVTVRETADGVFIVPSGGPAAMVTSEIPADNGVILVIDGVLLPEAEAAPGEELAAPLAEIMIPPMDEIMAPMAELMAPTSE